MTDAHGHRKVRALIQGGDVLLGVDELEPSRDEEVAAVDIARALDVDGGLGLGHRGARGAEDQALDVQDDIGNILNHVGDGHELVLGAIDLDRLNCRTLERGEQDAAERVAEGVAVTTLERLDGDTSGRLVDLFDLNLRPNEF